MQVISTDKRTVLFHFCQILLVYKAPEETPDDYALFIVQTLYCHTWTLSLGPSAFICEVLLHLYAAHSRWATIKNTHTCLFRKLRNCQSDNIGVNTESQGQRILLQTSDRIIWRYRSGGGYQKTSWTVEKMKGSENIPTVSSVFCTCHFPTLSRELGGGGLPKWSLNILVRGGPQPVRASAQ